MNREIKFRAWCSGKHGSLIFNESSMDYNVVLSKNGSWCDVEGEWDIHGEYKTVPVMQFTGMKDCNGKEIYEGDILEDIRFGYITQVKYRESSFVSESNVGYVGLFETENYKVIGNIYENPELLES